MSNKLDALRSIQHAKSGGAGRSLRTTEEYQTRRQQDEEERRKWRVHWANVRLEWKEREVDHLTHNNPVERCQGCDRILHPGEGYTHKKYEQLIYCGACLSRDLPGSGSV